MSRANRENKDYNKGMKFRSHGKTNQSRRGEWREKVGEKRRREVRQAIEKSRISDKYLFTFKLILLFLLHLFFLLSVLFLLSSFSSSSSSSCDS